MTIETTREALTDICSLAIAAHSADMACVVELTDGTKCIIRGAIGTNARAISGNLEIPGLDTETRPYLFFKNLKLEPWYAKHPLRNIAPFAKNLFVISVPNPEEGQRCYFTIFNLNGGHEVRNVDLAYISKLASIAGALCFPDQNSQNAKNPSASFLDVYLAAPSEGFSEDNTLFPFLMKTLIKQQTLRSRKGTSFITVRKWRAAVKDSQIAALQSIKAHPHFSAVQTIADEILSVARDLNGLGAFSGVVPVPCGSSGHNHCLSFMIAECIAEKLNLPFVNCLQGEFSKGLSHPHKSKTLKPYKIIGVAKGHLLLVDDVVTTGIHISNSVNTLRAAGASASAIGWIGQ